MTATIKTTENLDKRRIEGVVSVDDEGREFYVSVSHYGPRKAYMATFGRRIRTKYGYREVISTRSWDENPVSKTHMIPTARYSAKALREVYAKIKEDLVDPHIDLHIEWAKGARS